MNVINEIASVTGWFLSTIVCGIYFRFTKYLGFAELDVLGYSLRAFQKFLPLRDAGFLDFMLIGFSSLLKQDQWSLFHKPTRKHSSRMRTARLPTVRASVVATRRQSVLGGGAVQ